MFRYLHLWKIFFIQNCSEATLTRVKSITIPRSSPVEYISCIKDSVVMLSGGDEVMLYDSRKDYGLRFGPLVDSVGVAMVSSGRMIREPLDNASQNLGAEQAWYYPELDSLLFESHNPSSAGSWSILQHPIPSLHPLDATMLHLPDYEWPSIPAQLHMQLFRTYRSSLYQALVPDYSSDLRSHQSRASRRLHVSPHAVVGSLPDDVPLALPLQFLSLPDDVAGPRWTASGSPIAVSCHTRHASISLKFSPLTGRAEPNYCASLKVPELYKESWSLDSFDEVYGMAVATTANQVYLIQF